LASVHGDAIVVTAPGFEIGKLRWVVENTRIERFLFLQDSMVASEALYGLLSDSTGSLALLADPKPFGCYAGVYEAEILKRVGLPNIRSKKEAVEAEIWWTKAYIEAAGDVPILFPELSDRKAEGPVEHLGRQNLVLRNEFFTKYKGTWRHDQIDT
jgi:hypothetical protein